MKQVPNEKSWQKLDICWEQRRTRDLALSRLRNTHFQVLMVGQILEMGANRIYVGNQVVHML